MKHEIYLDKASPDSIEAIARAASQGDTLHFIPVNGKSLVVDRTIDITCMTVDAYGQPIPKQLHVEATGAVLYSSGLFPCLVVGAPLGHQVNMTLRNGTFMGGLVARNINGSRIEAEKIMGSGSTCPALEHITDAASGYNYFHIQGGLSGADIGFQMTLLNPDAWVNFFEMGNTPFGEKEDAGHVVAAIAVRAPAGVTLKYPPSCGLFRHIDVEGVGSLLDCPGTNVSFEFMDFSYWEGQIAGGVVGDGASICLDCPQGKLTGIDASDMRWNFMRRA